MDGVRGDFSGPPHGTTPAAVMVNKNKTVLELNCCIKLFADDTSLYIVAENPNTSAFLLNSSISTIHSWAEDGLVDFSAPKTDDMVITRKQIKPYHPSLIKDNVVITEVHVVEWKKLEDLFILNMNEASMALDDDVDIEMQRKRTDAALELCYVPLYKIGSDKTKIAFNNT